MVENLQETLRGGFNGLYGEVVTADCYRLKELDFIPSLILDVGANIGVFSRYARELFPDAKIIALEPDSDNCKVFRKFTNDTNTILIEKAIGHGGLWRCMNAENGAHECYLSEGLGYLKEDFIKKENVIAKRSSVETIMLDELINAYYEEGMKCILKLDIEGAENIIWAHLPSLLAMKKMDYICMEIHQFALTKECFSEVRQRTFEALAYFIPTHKCAWVNVNFYARKR